MPPIPLDTQELAMLEHYQQRLQALTKDRALRQLQLDRVSNERQRLKREYGLVHNSRVAAISRLPKEMLSEVFKLLHRSQRLLGNSKETGEGPAGRHQFGSPWRAEVVLSSVCSRWRTTAFGLPSLWSVFWCDQPSSCSHLVGELARFRTYLQRSGTHTLELFFDFTCREPYEPEPISSLTRFKELVQEMLGVAVGHAERWKQITILANDTRRRVPVTPLRADMWAPKLERMVICTGKPSGRMAAKEQGLDPQVLLLCKGDGDSPCPALQYLKLDRAGLQFYRPCITQLTHLVLEYGSAGFNHDDSKFVIGWPALVNILRSPQLESLSLCEKILCPDTFPDGPGIPWYYVLFCKLRHLRLGSSFRSDGWDGTPSRLLWFLLQYISAPRLKTLEVSSFVLGESPWSDETATQQWPDPEDFKKAYDEIHPFPSLQVLTISDIRIFTEEETAPLGFLLLERMTRSAQTLIFSDHQSSLIPILSRTYPFNGDGGFPGFEALLWPNASDISIDFEFNGQDEGRCLDSYAAWCLEIRSMWSNVSVVRLPAVWVDMWLARLKERAREDNDGDLDEKLGEEPWTVVVGNASSGGYPIKVIAFEEVFSRCWPPGSESTLFNTLKQEQFEPFRSGRA